MSLTKSCEIILNQCMTLKPNEKCLIITDSKLKRIGMELFRNASKITKKIKIVLVKIPKTHGAEPSKEVAKEMLKFDVILMPTTNSLSHTRARENASKKGARIASMPGISADMMQRTLDVDFYKIRGLNSKLISKLSNKTEIRITTKKGTNIKFHTQSRKWIGDDGIYAKRSAFGNLPAGEIFIAPLERKTNGKIVCDASVGAFGKVDKNLEIVVKNGYIKSIYGGKIANQFQKLLINKLYKNVAELGIGTNYKAKITGNVLEDEKVFGTCHIAFGNNKHFGGKVDVPFHVDFVIRNPRIYADGVLIINKN